MKFLHLADLHLGKQMNDLSLMEDQEAILDQMVSIARDERVDAVLIAGDVYQRSAPQAEAMALFDRIVNPALLVRRLNIVAAHVVRGAEQAQVPAVEQLDLFTDYAGLERQRAEEQARLEREDRIQQATLRIKKKFGKNALVKGLDLQEDATTIARNGQIGGHKA